MSTTPLRPILDEYCWHHTGPHNGNWSCKQCYEEQQDELREAAHAQLATVPSYTSRFSFLRDCITDGLLTESEATHHEDRDQLHREMSTAKIRAVLKEVAA